MAEVGAAEAEVVLVVADLVASVAEAQEEEEPAADGKK